jgi:predicted RNA-binding protein associated with RNAse of E/G family
MYRRPPHAPRAFSGFLLNETSNRLTIQSRLSLKEPRRVAGKIIADKDYLAVWFVFKGRWFDVGKFYDRSNNWLGYYCDIVKPVNRLLYGSKTSIITDLFLDLWISPENVYHVLDRDEFDDAVRRRLIPKRVAERAECELRRIIRSVERGEFPPAYVRAIRPNI